MAQALFANQRETNLQSTVALVEEVLAELGHPADKARTEEPDALHAWKIRQGSAATRVTVIHREEFTHIRVCAIVMTLDPAVERAALFGHLLELNARLCGNAFALVGDQVLLFTERSTIDLDRSEVLDLIRRVTTNADKYDDVLVGTFGGTLGEA